LGRVGFVMSCCRIESPQSSAFFGKSRARQVIYKTVHMAFAT
jgi:hypothetical protein